MSGLKFLGAVVCDDVRREENGKEMLIGVYSSEMLVGTFPANLRLYFWAMIRSEGTELHRFELRIIGPNGVQLLQGEAEAQLAKADSDGSMPIGPIPVQLQSPGDLRLEVKLPGADWQEVKRLPVVRREG